MRWFVPVCLAVATSCGPAPVAPRSAPRPEPAAPALGELFGGLEPPTMEPDEAPGLTLRDGPPAPGALRAEVPFPAPEPPAEPAPAASAAPLVVQSWSPRGDQDLVGAVRVTFSQPMVPLATLAELSRAEAPLRIEPRPPGRFRWLGSRTVAFEPEGRLPKSTTYRVHVPAGTRSALGGALAEALSFEIRTPSPTIDWTLPWRDATGVGTRPVVALCFDQRVEPSVIAGATTLAPAGRLELVPPARVPALAEDHPSLTGCHDGRLVVLRPAEPLRPGTRYEVRVAAGTPGAEGPNPIAEPLTTGFTTYRPLAVTEIRCGYGGVCRPGTPITVSTTNSLVGDGAEVTVSPRVPRLHRRASGARVVLEGDFAADTTYRVSVAAGLTDAHGQTLGRAVTRSVHVGDAAPHVQVDADRLATIERAGPRVVPVSGINVPRVRASSASIPPERLGEVLGVLIDGRWTRTASVDPFVEARLRPRTFVAALPGPRNRPAVAAVDVAPELPAGRSGYALVRVRSVDRERRLDRVLLVQATDLGVVAHVDHAGAVVRVVSLASGAPVASASVRMQRLDEDVTLAEAVTDDAGLARLPVSPGGRVRIVVRRGDDEAFVAVAPRGTEAELVGTVFTDRDPYRPGDTVRVRVVARLVDDTVAATTGRLPGDSAARCSVHEPSGAEDGAFDEVLDAFGAAAAAIELPQDAATGTYEVRCRVEGVRGTLGTSFRVAEYRAPEIAVSVEPPAGPVFHGARPAFDVRGRYHFGGRAAGRSVRWTVGHEPASYSPPGHDGWSFGTRPRRGPAFEGPDWLRRHERHRAVHRTGPEERAILEQGMGVLDADGGLRVPVSLPPGDSPTRYVFEAEVTDASRQAVAGRASVVAHPAAVYVGLRPERAFPSSREPIVVGVVVVGVDGSPRPGRSVTLRALERRGRLVSRRDPGGAWSFEWEHDDREIGACELTSGEGAGRCRFGPQPPGRYVLEARARDAEGREAVTSTPVYVHGGGWVPFGDDTQRAELVADRPQYAPGDTARVLVRLPFAGGRGLVSVERAGALQTRPVDLDGSLHVLEVPIEAGHTPAVHVRVSVTRPRASRAELAAMLAGAGPDALLAAESDVGRPTWATGLVRLPVVDAGKRLSVVVAPDHAERRPGQPVRVSLTVSEPDGAPADAAVTVMVVDEAVLSLLEWETPDPLPPMHPLPPTIVVADALHGHVVRRRPLRQQLEDMLAHGRDHGWLLSRAAGDARSPSRRGRRVIQLDELAIEGREEAAPALPDELRTRFATTAFYRASTTTDASGRAEVSFDLPDDLTTFRVMAVAVGRGDHAGRGESRVTVRKPVLLRPALPRFAALGDRFEASVVAHNETGRRARMRVGLRAAGVELEGEAVREISLEAGEAREVAFPVRVVEARGVARLQFAASAAGGADAVEVGLPLNAPATSEAFAVYGAAEPGAALRVPLRVPSEALAGWGGLDVSFGASALTGLEDAARFLADYPYDCAEQIASRLVAASALVEVLEGRDAQGRAVALALGRRAIGQLADLQEWSGGFRYWPGSPRTSLYVSAWATLSLHEARRAGFEVGDRVLERAQRFLDQRLAQPADHLGEDRSMAVQALGLYAQAATGGRARPDVLDRVYRRRDQLPVFAKAWLAVALRERAAADPRAAELWRQIESAAVETPSGAHFAESTVESARLLWHTSRRTDAIVLAAMLEHRPDHPLVDKAARALSASRRGGRWHTTQENAWALAALVRYHREREGPVPDLSVQTWLGASFLGRTELRGRDAAPVHGRLPMPALRRMGGGDLIVAPEGAGRLYYRLGLRYAPTDLHLPFEEQGFSVTRVYEPTEDDADVRRDDDGTWRVRAGAVVRVRLVVVVPDDRYDVAVDDPLPAGLEAVDMAWSTTATQRLAGAHDDLHYDAGHLWAWLAFDHRELRDDRVVAFAGHAPAGVYEVTYLARASTPGRFVAGPARAEEMYEPEVFGRTATDVVVVERSPPARMQR